MTPHIIGISGVTGAGKSTLAKALAGDLKSTLVSWDDFDNVSQDPEDFIVWHNQGKDYKAFQRKELAKVLAALKKGKRAHHPVFETPLEATPYIIFDAPLGRFHEETGQYINTWIHLDVPLDVSLCRRTLRDFSDASKTKEELLEGLNFYLNHSRPLYFDDDYKKGADLVLDGLLGTKTHLALIKQYLKEKK